MDEKTLNALVKTLCEQMGTMVDSMPENEQAVANKVRNEVEQMLMNEMAKVARAEMAKMSSVNS